MRMLLLVVLASFPLLFSFHGANALDVTADSCNQADVQAAVYQVEAAGGGTVSIPAGDCTWSNTLDITGDVNIIGTGVDKTILRMTDNRFFLDYDAATFVRVSGIRFMSIGSANPSGVKLRNVHSFRVDNCHFEGVQHFTAPIDWKSATMGLIDHNTFINPNEPYVGSYYGATAGSPYAGGMPTEICDNEICTCWAGDPDAGERPSSVASGNTVISEASAIIDNAGGSGQGTVRRIYIEIDSVGLNPTVSVASFQNIGGNTFSARARTENLLVSEGKNIFTVDDEDFTPFEIHAGDYIGIYLNDCSVDASSGSTGWTLSGDQTGQASVDFGPPDIGGISIGAELFDIEGDFEGCEASWDYWYDDVGNQRPSYSGFDEDFLPGTDQAVYIEDNYFDWYKAGIEGNWANSHAYIVRHNTFKRHSGAVHIGFKPGSVFTIIHDNTFEETGGGAAGYAIRIRGSGLIYNNIFIKQSSGYQANGMRSYTHYFPQQVRMDELFIWNNNYQGCICGDNDLDCFGGINGGGDYALVGVGENGNIHIREPLPGDRLYGFQEYPYPHPWVAAQGDCDVSADSCSATDIQAAIDGCITRGGGTVCIPPCQADDTWGSNDKIDITTDVTFRLKGAGMDSTVIGYQDGANTDAGMYFGGTGLVELSDFTFRGSDTVGIPTGIKIYSMNTDNLRIHHIRIQKFKITGLYICDNPDSPMVIDHCEIGDQYETYMYGIRVHGTNQQSDFVIPASFGVNNPNALFIEDNAFDGCYHSVSAFAASNVVFRHNTVTNPTSYIDGHGPCFDVGCYRDADPDSGTYIYEIYDNTIDSGTYPWCINIRGGTGIVTDNSFINCNTGFRLETETCSAGIDCSISQGCPHSNTDTNKCYQAPNQWWIWGNTNTNFAYNDKGTGCIREDYEYYLRAPQTGDPVESYTKYPYPHPLVGGQSPLPPQTCSEKGGTTCCQSNEICLGTGLGAATDCPTTCCSGTCCTDSDSDGYASQACGGNDCDDSNPNKNPGAEEVCGNGLDDDCVGGDASCPVCSQGAIPSTGCDCGGTTHYSGYCCNDIYQGTACIVEEGWLTPAAVIGSCGYTSSQFADRLIDDDTQTSWQHFTTTNPEKHWVILDMGDSYDISTARLYHESYTATRAMEEIYVSEDTINWGSSLGSMPAIGYGDAGYGTSGFREIDITDKTGRYIRLVSENSTSVKWQEFDAFVEQPAQHHPADTSPQDGCIVMAELTSYIDLWLQDSQAVGMPELMGAVTLWRAGTGC